MRRKSIRARKCGPFDFVKRLYYQDFKSICVKEQVSDQGSFFILRSSTNRCKDQIKSVMSKRLKVLLCLVLQSNEDVATLSLLEDLLEPRMSVSLTEMSSLDPKNCRPNEKVMVLLTASLLSPYIYGQF